MDYVDSPALRRMLFHELAKLSDAGLPMERIGELLRRRWKNPGMHRVAAVLDQGITRGGTISEALAPAMSGMETAVVEAAEKSGRLAEGFQYLADWHEQRLKMRQTIRKALLYPLTLLHASAILPAVVETFTANTPPWPALIRNLTILWVVLAGGFLIWKSLSRAAGRSKGADRLLRALPVAGRVHRDTALARWCLALHFQIQAGRLISQALEAAGRAAGSIAVREASDRAADSALSGHPIGPSLLEEKVMDQGCSASIATAEESGTLDTETALWAKLLAANAAESMESAGRTIPRIIYGAAVIYAVFEIMHLARIYFSLMTRDIDSL